MLIALEALFQTQDLLGKLSGFLSQINSALPLAHQTDNFDLLPAAVSAVLATCARVTEAVDSILPDASSRYPDASALVAALRDQIITTSGRTFHAGDLVDGIKNIALSTWLLSPADLTPQSVADSVLTWVRDLALIPEETTWKKSGILQASGPYDEPFLGAAP